LHARIAPPPHPNPTPHTPQPGTALGITDDPNLGSAPAFPAFPTFPSPLGQARGLGSSAPHARMRTSMTLRLAAVKVEGVLDCGRIHKVQRSIDPGVHRSCQHIPSWPPVCPPRLPPIVGWRLPSTACTRPPEAWGRTAAGGLGHEDAAATRTRARAAQPAAHMHMHRRAHASDTTVYARTRARMQERVCEEQARVVEAHGPDLTYDLLGGERVGVGGRC
jgi:hypothetical protein